MKLGKRLEELRVNKGLTQAQLAEALGVSLQTVFSWERDESLPETAKLWAIAAALDTTLCNLLEEDAGFYPLFELDDRIFHEDRMYAFIQSAASAQDMPQTLKALPFARQAHKNQVRKGEPGIPYINHPLTMCCHALAMGIREDRVIAAILLHDVVEDCEFGLCDLPVTEEVRHIVDLLTWKGEPLVDEDIYDQSYYAAIQQNPQAALIKLIDRCNNLATMAGGLKKERMREYLEHTHRFILPLANTLQDSYPPYQDACFLLKYHIRSLMYAIIKTAQL